MTTLRHKKTKQWAAYMGDGQFGTCDIPKIMGDITKEHLIVYAQSFDGIDISEKLDEYELVQVEVTVK